MARYTGPRLRLVRQFGELPGLTSKEPKRTNPPGQHGALRRKLSDFGTQLREKQKIKFNYGISEKVMLKYFKAASRSRVPSGTALLRTLESRLDNVVFRLGMAPSIPAARQLVGHKHILLNGKPVSIASIHVKPGDVITVKPNENSQALVRKSLEKPSFMLPEHLTVDAKELRGTMTAVPPREVVLVKVNETLVVNYYSRRT